MKAYQKSLSEIKLVIRRKKIFMITMAVVA